MSDNRLRRLDDGTFYGLGALEQLYVRGNQLVEVAPRALTPVADALKHLDLADNRLQTIDFRSLAEVDRLTFVDLTSNPWTKVVWSLVVCALPVVARKKLLSSVLDQNATVICDVERSPSTEQPTASPPVDVVDRWLRFVCIVAVVTLTLGVTVVLGLVLTVRRARSSAVWTPCKDEVDVAGSSETGRSDDGDRKIHEVNTVDGHVTTICEVTQASSELV